MEIDIASLGPLIESIGIPALFFVVVLYLILKVYPDFMKLKQEDRAHTAAEKQSQQEYYSQRDASYREQMSLISRIAEHGNQMIGQATQVLQQSNDVIKSNTEAIHANTEIYKDIKEAMQYNSETTHVLIQDYKTHDQRAEKMYTGIEKLLDRTH